MVTILAVVTAVSLILTIGLSIVLVRLMREERRRSDARVAMLAQAASIDEPADAVFADEIAVDASAFDRFVREREPREDRGIIDRSVREDRGMVDRGVIANDMFAIRHQRSPWPWRAGVAATIALLLSTIVLAIRVLQPALHREDVPRSSAAVPASQQQVQTGLLELLSLKHEQQGDRLTITGLVQNPRDGVPLTKVTATAFLFGSDGAFLASGRAPLDFTLLRPGDESGFVITVPTTGTVARYRVGFRSEDGRIIGHVDRRAGPSIARLETGWQ